MEPDISQKPTIDYEDLAKRIQELPSEINNEIAEYSATHLDLSKSLETVIAFRKQRLFNSRNFRHYNYPVFAQEINGESQLLINYNSNHGNYNIHNHVKDIPSDNLKAYYSRLDVGRMRNFKVINNNHYDCLYKVYALTQNNDLLFIYKDKSYVIDQNNTLKNIHSFEIDKNDANVIMYIEKDLENKQLLLKSRQIAGNKVVSYPSAELTNVFWNRIDHYDNPLSIIKVTDSLIALHSKEDEPIIFIENGLERTFQKKDLIPIPNANFDIKFLWLETYHVKSNKWIFISLMYNKTTLRYHPAIHLFDLPSKQVTTLILNQLTYEDLINHDRFHLQWTQDDNLFLISMHGYTFACKFINNTLTLKYFFLHDHWYKNVKSFVLHTFDRQLDILAKKPENDYWGKESENILYSIPDWKSFFKSATGVHEYLMFACIYKKNIEQVIFLQAFEQLLLITATLNGPQHKLYIEYRRLIRHWMRSRPKELALPKYFAQLCLEFSTYKN